MKRRTDTQFIVIIWIVTLVLVSCAPASTTQPLPTAAKPTEKINLPIEPESDPSSKVLTSEVERDLNPQVGSSGIETLVSDNNDFALEFYHKVRTQDGNLFFSPYSLSVALAMTYAGARTETEQQMAETMHYGLSQEALHTAFNALDFKLTQRSVDEVAEGEPQPFQLNIANAIWGQIGHPFLPEFLDTLAMNYGAGLRLTDFILEVEQSRQEINHWVEDQTKDRIKDLIPEGLLHEETRLVLTNAIYFKADWQKPFAKELTGDATFTKLDGSQIDVLMMSHSEAQSYSYSEGEGFQVLEMPYVGDEIVMLLLVPDLGNFEAFEDGLDESKLQMIISGLEPHQVDLSLPKFSFTRKLNVKRALIEMGMTDAFQDSLADFSGMDGEPDLYIQNIFHKAFIAVDERGTEAAAATAVDMSLKALIEPGVQMTVDRPFILLIRDRTTGTILFVGRVLDPSEGEK